MQRKGIKDLTLRFTSMEGLFLDEVFKCDAEDSNAHKTYEDMLLVALQWYYKKRKQQIKNERANRKNS